METALEPVKDIALISKYEVTVESIATAVEIADAMIVTGPDDGPGMANARKHRLVLVKMRTTIEAKRKELKVEPLDYLRGIDETAKELTEPLPPAEARLKGLEETAAREKERLEKIEREKRAVEIQHRCRMMDKVTGSIPIDVLQKMTTEEFDTKYAELKESFKAQLKKDIDLAEAQKSERARLHRLAEEQAEKQLEFERREAEQAERQKKIDAAEQKIRAEVLTMRGSELSALGVTMEPDMLYALSEDEFSSLLALKKTALEEKKEAAAKATKARVAQEEVSRAAREAEAVWAEEERKSDAAVRAPDREKIESFRMAIAEIPLPCLTGKSQRQQKLCTEARNNLIDRLHDIAEDLA